MRRVLEMVGEADGTLGEVQSYWRPKRLRQHRSGKGRSEEPPEERDRPMPKKREKRGRKPGGRKREEP